MPAPPQQQQPSQPQRQRRPGTPTVVPSPERPAVTGRSWYWDFLSALAFFGQAIVLGKLLGRALGPFAGLFCFCLCGGIGWFFWRSGWRGLTEARERGRGKE